MTAAESLDHTVLEAQRLRDYLLKVGEESHQGLVAALQPFERVDSQPSEAEIAGLYDEFRAAHRRARAVLDEHTLNEVLNGRSPFDRSGWRTGSLREGSTAIATALFGAILVLVALHFTYWSNRAAFALTEVERVASFDSLGQAIKLVELERLFETTISDANRVDLEPFRMYSESMSMLSSHFLVEQNIPGKLRQLDLEFNPVRLLIDSRARLLCGATGEPYVRLFFLYPVRCAPAAPPAPAETVAAAAPEAEAAKLEGGGDVIEARAAGTEPIDDRTPYERYLEEQIRTLTSTMQDAGWPGSGGAITADTVRYSVAGKAEQLREKLNIVYRWALPIIYGALGSVVYCIWRVLSPAVAPLGFYYTILRTSFAALAALTLSMLLIPSNALALGAEVSRPLIYLFSFVFGYSVEAFVSTLNNLNRLLNTSLAPKERAGRSG